MLIDRATLKYFRSLFVETTVHPTRTGAIHGKVFYWLISIKSPNSSVLLKKIGKWILAF